MTWISDIAARIAAATGIEGHTLVVRPADTDTVVRLVAIAADERQQRTNARRLGHVLGPTVALDTHLEARLVDRAG
jgi:hypothetical protein